MAGSHQHDFLGHSHARNERRTRFVVLLSAVMMIAEIATGTVTGSMALVADGWHMGTHTLALGMSAFAYWLARRWATDPRYSFGTGKLGSLAGFASALALGAAAIGIAAESATRLFEPRNIDFREAILVAVLGLVVNLVSAALLHEGKHHHRSGHHHGHEGHDHNLRSAYLHVLSDALTSVLAIAALAAGMWAGVAWLDPAVGILGALLIAVWSFGLIRDTSAVLLDRVPDPALEADIRAAVESGGDARITDLHLWQIGPGGYAVIVALTGEVDRHEVRRRIGNDPRLAHVTVEIA